MCRKRSARFRFAQHGKKRERRETQMPRTTRRTIRKLTCWHPGEWARIEEAVSTAGVPALRFVREAALEKADGLRGGSPPPAPPTPTLAPLTPPARHRRAQTAGDELVHQLGRVLNNLNQLHRIAEIDGDAKGARLVDAVIDIANRATVAAPDRAAAATMLLAELVPAGTALNDLARSANGADQLPPDTPDVLARVFAIVSSFLR
jgi:hypothetical protein